MDNIWAFCSKPALYRISHAQNQIIHKVIHSFGGKSLWRPGIRGNSGAFVADMGLSRPELGFVQHAAVAAPEPSAPEGFGWKCRVR
jgi:hypothetical protein